MALALYPFFARARSLSNSDGPLAMRGWISFTTFEIGWAAILTNTPHQQMFSKRFPSLVSI
jgi:hypothetical protein